MVGSYPQQVYAVLSHFPAEANNGRLVSKKNAGAPPYGSMEVWHVRNHFAGHHWPDYDPAYLVAAVYAHWLGAGVYQGAAQGHGSPVDYRGGCPGGAYL